MSAALPDNAARVALIAAASLLACADGTHPLRETSDSPAVESYLRALDHVVRYEEDDAVRLLFQAIEIDSGYVPAYVEILQYFGTYHVPEHIVSEIELWLDDPLGELCARSIMASYETRRIAPDESWSTDDGCGALALARNSGAERLDAMQAAARLALSGSFRRS